MTDDAKFDALSRKANESGGAMEDMNELFGAVFALEHWEFISRGELPNPYPYIASNPTVAGNQPMIRAFTGGDRLLRFARENHLVREDGSCDALKIPTDNIVEYLEGFIAQGAYGVWFNSDAQSDGFFIPLKQLRPIKEHLVKEHLAKKSVQSCESASAAAPAQKPSAETLQFVVKEGLMLPSAEIIPAPYTSNLFWRVPSDWVEDGKIKAEHLRKIEAKMSGGRSENIDGAFYVVTDYSTKILTPEVVRTTKWSEIVNEGDDLNMFYVASENGETENVSAQEFQANVDAFFKSGDKSVQVPGEPIPAFVTLIVQIKDGLGFPSGFVKEADYTCHIFCRVPEFWIDGEQLKAEYLEKIYAQFYGVTWRMGNSDGSHFVVRDCYVKILPPGMLKNIQWTGTVNDDKNQYWWYIASADGEVRSVKEEEFGAHINAEPQAPVKALETPARSGLQDSGFAESPGGEIDLNLTVNKVGAVDFETSIAPFYEAIVPLLEDYRGVGEYVTLLRFEPGAMSQSVENIAENSHGAYLQIRRFVYLNPKNNVRIGVNSIHSKSLRHVRTNSELLVSFELCKNLDNQTAVFYHAFQGPKSEVSKLSAAIEPILERFGYRAAEQ